MPFRRAPGRGLTLLLALVLSSPVLLAADAPSGWEWRNPLPTGEYLLGETWTGTQLVAVGNGGLVTTSPDGTRWTLRPLGVADGLNAVTWTGTQLVAVGQCVSCADQQSGAVFTSPDGIRWTRRDPGPSAPLFAVTWTGTQLVAAGDRGVILTSPDGISWTARPSGVTEHLEVVLAVPPAGNGAGFLVVAGYGGTVLTSPDGSQWTRREARKGAYLRGGTVAGTRILLVGEDLEREPTWGVILTSEDGATWTDGTPQVANQPLRSAALNGSRIVVVGESMSQQNYPGPAIVLTSEDGVTWTRRDSGIDFVLGSVAWTGQRFVAVGWSGAIVVSPDGIAWTRGGEGPTPDMNAFADGGDRGLVAVGRKGGIATSPDGRSWTLRKSGTEKDLLAVTWTDRSFVAAGREGTVLLSADGVAWRAVDPGVTQDLAAVLCTGSGLVAAGAGGTLLASADGERWTKLPSPTTTTLKGLALAPGLLVAVGGDTDGVILSSADGGATWTDRTSPGLPNLAAVAASGSLFVAVGGGSGGAAASSRDGLDWSGAVRWIAPAYLNAVAWDGTRFLAVGNAGVMLSSPDGVAWSAEPFFTAVNLASAGLGGGRLYALGENGVVLERTGGRSWKYWVPVVVHSPGAFGAFWQTDVALLNPPAAVDGAAGTATVAVSFHSPLGVVKETLAVQAGRQEILRDVAGGIFALSGLAAATGTLEVDSSRPLAVASRTFTARSAGEACLPGATMGQVIPAVEAGVGFGTGDSASLPQLAETDAVRTNIAVANTGTVPAKARVRLFNGAGKGLGLYDVSLAPGEWQQETRPFSSASGGGGLATAYAQLLVTAGSGVLAYASVVDNRTNDAAFVPAVPLSGCASNRAWLPVAMHVEGADGSAWRTDVGLLNPGTAATDVDLLWHGPAGTTRSSAHVAGRQQAVLVDVVAQIPADGAGALEILSNLPVIATSRLTFQRPAGATCLPGGSFGRAFRATCPGDGLSAGETGWLPMLREEGDFRTNLELTNAGEVPMQLLVELFDSEGHILASYPLSLSAGEYHQERRPFLVRAGRSDLESAWAAVTVLSGRDLLAFSSVLDARSNDPGVRSGAPEE